MKTLFSVFSLALLLGLIASCSEQTGTIETAGGDVYAKTLFKNNCQICHGANGALGLNGAGNLQESTLSLEERIDIITNGKGAMTPYRSVLSAQEIAAVAEYSLSLAKLE